CSVAPGHGRRGLPWGAVALLALFALLLRRGQRRAAGASAAGLVATGALVAGATALAPAISHAQDVQLYQPAPGVEGYFGVEGARTLGENVLVPALHLHVANAPLVTRDRYSEELIEKQDYVEYLATMDVQLAYGLLDGLDLVLDVPLHDTQGTLIESAGNDGAHLGDIRVGARAALLKIKPGQQFGVTLSVPVSLPTGSDEGFVGEGGAAVSPSLIAEWVGGRLRAGAQIGARFRTEDHTLSTLDLSHELAWGAGIGAHLFDNLEGLIEVAGRSPLTDVNPLSAGSPVEGRAGLRYVDDSGFAISAGAGTGFAEDYGAPRWRAFVGLAYVGDPCGGDSDGDGIGDACDRCPEVADADQIDSDGDGVGDACDVCPWAEEECPCPIPTPTDLDADGIDDGDDNCPGLGNPDQADADQDGRGDRCDFCPNTFDDAEHGCPLSIPAVKRRQVPQSQLIEVTGVVTGIVTDPGTAAGSFFLEAAADAGFDPLAGHVGLYVYMGNRRVGIDPPAVGQRVTVAARFNIYFGQTQLHQVARLDVADPEELPPPLALTVQEVLDGGPVYEGQRVCVARVQVTDIAPPPGAGDGNAGPTNEFVVAHGPDEDGVRVDDFLYREDPLPALDDRFVRVCGVLRLANENYKIEPRDRTDLDRGPPVVIAIEPPLSFLRAGDEGVPQGFDGEPLTVVLSAIAEMPVAVQVESGDPAALLTTGAVVVPVGERRATLTLEGVLPAEAVAVRAWTAEQEAPIEATVRVVGPEDVPTTLRFDPAELELAMLEQRDVLLRLDLPAPPDQVATVHVEPAGIVSVPAEVEFDPNAMFARFTVEALAAGDAVITADLGDLHAEATVTVSAVPIDPIISEVNYDMTGVEDHEYVEIQNPGNAPIPLAGLTLGMVNGSNGQRYRTFDLNNAGAALPGGAFLVVGDPAVRDLLPPGALFLAIASANDNHDFQNGDPDGVEITRNGEILDSVVYARGEIASLPDAVVIPDDPNDATTRAPSRCVAADGTVSWRLVDGTPGAPNACQ
ncbi:MAG: lamin tail domain-containing protein, partial [Myxococcales bacterium]|nr:lamin tail domain-containing protein [Myxococcales bacterium]